MMILSCSIQYYTAVTRGVSPLVSRLKSVEAMYKIQRVCIIINADMPWYDDVHHHLLIYEHTGPVCKSLFCKTKKFVNRDLHVINS